MLCDGWHCLGLAIVMIVKLGPASMENQGKNLGGRAYLAGKLREVGVSRRDAVRILNVVFREMGKALRRGKYVEFPFGHLKAVKKLSQRWEMLNDEPMRPYTVEHELDEEGHRLLDEAKPPKLVPGWSQNSGK